jgi:hypothetical protein
LAYLHVATGSNGLGVVGLLDRFPVIPAGAIDPLTLAATAT